MTDCIFCDIVANLAPANFVYQDELCVAFMDIRPVNPGHVLVVPRLHASLLTELDPASAERLMIVAQRVDTALRNSGIPCEGVNLFLADGEVAMQEVMHVHLHVIPRFRGDKHQLRFSPKAFSRPPAAELEKTAGLIRAAMGGD